MFFLCENQKLLETNISNSDTAIMAKAMAACWVSHPKNRIYEPMLA